MSTRTLERSQWQNYFDNVSKSLLGKGVDIEVLSNDFGAQKPGMNWHMYGISYDPQDNIVEVVADRLDHLIDDPAQIQVEEDGFTLKVIEVTQGNGVRQLIEIREVLALPQYLHQRPTGQKEYESEVTAK